MRSCVWAVLFSCVFFLFSGNLFPSYAGCPYVSTGNVVGIGSCSSQGVGTSCKSGGPNGAGFYEASKFLNSGNSCIYNDCICDSLAEARSCACGGGGGLTKPTCSVRTTDNYGNATSVFNNGDRINIKIDAGDNGEVYGGTSGSPATAYPTFSGACNGLVGFCPATNLCSGDSCSDVCATSKGGGDLRLAASNPNASSRTCTINFSASNGPNKGTGSGTCSTTVTVNGATPRPNLEITSLSIPNGSQRGAAVATVVIKNTGTQNVSGNFRVAFDRLGSNLSCGQGNQFAIVNGLNISQSKSVNINFTYPNTTGLKTAVSMVDSGPLRGSCQITESNENDNVRTGNYRVTCTLVSAPTGLLATALGLGSYRFSWNASSGTAPISYSFAISGPGLNQTVANVTSPYTFPTQLAPGQTYNWAITAANSCPSSAVASSSLTVSCYGAFLTITNTDNSCSGKPGLGISGGFNMGQNNINSNQAYSIGFSSGGFYDVIPATFSVPATCSGEAGPVNISCVDWPTYFQTFGGNVTAASGTLEDRNVPAGGFISGNIVSQPKSAGVVSGNSITAINAGGGSFSAQGFNLTPYQTSGAERKGTDYESLLIAALKYGGYSLTNMSSACGVTKTIGGQSVKYSCWSGSSLNSALTDALADSATLQILLPQNVFGDPVGLTSAALAVNGKHVIAFVPASVNISQRVSVGSGSDSTFTLISSGDVSVTQGSVDALSGSYLFEGDFANSASATPMNGFGQIYAVGPSSTISLQRQVAGAAAETFNYQGGKYLKVLTPILTSPKTFWSELAPN